MIISPYLQDVSPYLVHHQVWLLHIPALVLLIFLTGLCDILIQQSSFWAVILGSVYLLILPI